MFSRIVNKHGYVLECSTIHEGCRDCQQLMKTALGNNLHVVIKLTLQTDDGEHLARLTRIGADAWGGTSNRFINPDQEGR